MGGSFLFAYAKPVPYNPYNLRGGKWGPVKVAFAGPAANFFLAAAFGIFVRLIVSLGLVQFYTLLPFFSIIVYTNILLGVFNLVPIPPLDGSKLLFALLPEKANELKKFFAQYGIFILFGFIFFGFKLITPIMGALYILFTGMAF